MKNKENVENTKIKKAIKIEDDELESVSGGEEKEFCIESCDGSLVGVCGWHGNCPFKQH